MTDSGAPSLLRLLAAIEGGGSLRAFADGDKLTLQAALAAAREIGLVTLDPPALTPEGRAWAQEQLAPLQVLMPQPAPVVQVVSKRRGAKEARLARYVEAAGGGTRTVREIAKAVGATRNGASAYLRRHAIAYADGRSHTRASEPAENRITVPAMTTQPRGTSK